MLKLKKSVKYCYIGSFHVIIIFRMEMFMTVHNKALKEDIAKTVLMPGDPLRAKYIAEHFLDDWKMVNDVRNMYAYTGFYKGKKVTIMASGMGIPSMGIYSYELFKFYDVDTIIRIGSAGAYTDKLKLYDVVLVNGTYSESNYAMEQSGEEQKILYGSSELNNHLKDVAKKLDITLHFNNIYCSEAFYKNKDNYQEIYQKYGCVGVEMESFALFHNARVLGKKAACLLTISDSLVTHYEITSEEREKSFHTMIRIALESLL